MNETGILTLVFLGRVLPSEIKVGKLIYFHWKHHLPTRFFLMMDNRTCITFELKNI